MTARDDLAELVLDALCDSDDGNNPFFRDDDDTVSLADQIADAIVAAGWPRAAA